MPNNNLNNEQKITRNILYSILAITIFFSFVVDFYDLIDEKYRYFINFAKVGIFGIIFYIGYKKQLVNKTSSIFTIILVFIIFTITMLIRYV
jgi:hypothetical protein